MPITQKDLINSAKLMINAGNLSLSEVDYRNAISRAYYAAYHEADRVANKYSKGNSGNKHGMHEKLINKLISHPNIQQRDAVINQIGSLLRMCKKQRVRADYRLRATLSKTDAEATLLNCEQIINLTVQFP